MESACKCRGISPTIILVDNGSDDGSYEYIRQFKIKYPEERIIVTREGRKGASYARNKGLELCDTEYIYFFDSDDDFSIDFFQEMNHVCKKAKEDVIIITTTQCIGNQCKTRAFRQTGNPAVQILNGMLSTQSMIFKTDFIRRIGGWNNSLLTWDDWELGIRTLLARPYIKWHTEHPFHCIRIHPDSITGSCFSERIDYIRKALKAAAEMIYNLPDSDSNKKTSQTALFYRIKILEGHLLLEKNKEVAADLDTLLEDRLQEIPSLTKVAGYLLKKYAEHGGRGAWRLALAITHPSQKTTDQNRICRR